MVATMKKQILMMMAVVFLGGCAAGREPVWKQELNNLHRYHRNYSDPVVVQPKFSKPDYSVNGLYSCGIQGDYR